MAQIPANPSVDVESLKPFKKFIMTIGNLPTSFLESLSYAELVMWFCNFLQEQVIPAVNNNASAVEELQGLYVELKSYVDNYFTDLDVQEEINNKLDEMAEDGTLTNLIKNYIDPIQNEFEQQIIDSNNNFKSDVREELNNFNTRLSSVASGSPLSANSISDMIDTNRIYVLTTNGNWYYYNGNEWVSGGIYEATTIYDDYKVPTKVYKDLDNKLQINDEYTFVQGARSRVTLEIQENSKRLTSQNIENNDKIILVSNNPKYDSVVCIKPLDREEYVDTIWHQEAFIIPNNFNYFMNVRRYDNTDISITEINNIWFKYLPKIVNFENINIADIIFMVTGYRQYTPSFERNDRAMTPQFFISKKPIKLYCNSEYGTSVFIYNNNFEGESTIINFDNTEEFITIPKNKYFKLYLRKLDDSELGNILDKISIENILSFESIEEQRNDRAFLNVMAWNVGNFNNGATGGYSGDDINGFIANFAKSMSKVNPDICMISESRQYINSTNTVSADTELYGKIIDYYADTNTENYSRVLLSQYEISDVEKKYFSNIGTAGGSNGYVCGYINCDNDKKIRICTVHLNWKEESAGGVIYRQEQMQELINKFANDEYVIIGGDFNTITMSEYDTLINAGYQISNGNVWGTEVTFPSTQRPLDNIVVKGNIKIRDFQVLSTELSDHYLITSRLEIK